VGPPDGRYLVRRPDDGLAEDPSHVLVLATLGAPERRRLLARRRRAATPEPAPAAVTTSRATVVDVGAPLSDAETARAWLAGAGEDDLAADIAVLNRALHAHRVVSADPYAQPVRREQAIVARVGFGSGEQVAEGHWTAARELIFSPPRRRRLKALVPQVRLAGILAGREPALVCEELVLRARLDLDHGRDREATLQVLVALDAALAELPGDPAGPALSERLAELREQRGPIARAAQSALAGTPPPEEQDAVALTLGRLEAVLRARAAESRSR
jgi:hypothetical protein